LNFISAYGMVTLKNKYLYTPDQLMNPNWLCKAVIVSLYGIVVIEFLFVTLILRRIKMLQHRFSVVVWMVVLVVAGMILSLPVWSADFPEKGKSIMLITPYEAGGSPDVGARLMASGLEKELGVPVVVVNKPGASTQVGLTQLLQAKPDGYTFALMSFPTSLTPYLEPKRKAGYNRKSFQPLAMHVLDPCILAVKADSPYKNLKDLLAAAKANPKKITAAVGVLNDDHFSCLMVEKAAGIKFAHVTFAGGMAPALVQLIGGKIDVYFGNIGDMRTAVKNGQARILGVLDDERSPFFPEVKTFEEQGYKVYNSSSRAFVLPAGVPKDVLDTLSVAIKKVMDSDEHKKRMADMSLGLRFMDPARLANFWEKYEAEAIELMEIAKKN
jgi:tripartite-type tricarboxylate transporter receptor subunit TctC